MSKHRKLGDWKAVAKARDNKPRQVRQGHGLSNIPSVTDVGSAAYRRIKPGGKQ